MGAERRIINGCGNGSESEGAYGDDAGGVRGKHIVAGAAQSFPGEPGVPADDIVGLHLPVIGIDVV